MLAKILPTVGVALAVALASLGCSEDSPSQPAADGGMPDAQVDASLSADEDAPSSESDTPPPDAGPPPSSVGDCCQTQSTAGCETPAVEACVCAVDRWCCAGEWDDRCVALVESEGCGLCGEPPSTVCEAVQTSDELPAALAGTLGGEQVVDALELSCGSIAEPDVVFAFTAPEAGSYAFSTAGSEVIDTVLAVLDGTECDGEELGCNDDGADDLSASLTVQLEEGQRVLIAVESWGEESGDVEVAITASSGGAFDPESCTASALPSTMPAMVEGEAHAAVDLLTPSCAPVSSGETFYTFTAAEDGYYRFDTRGSEADTIVQLLDGSCAGVELACNDDPDLGGLAAVTDIELFAGQTVLVNVDSYDGTGSYMLTVDLFDPEAEPPAPMSGDCCSEQDSACDDAEIVACVCAVDDYCCNDWDPLCAVAVATLACGSCG